MRRMMSIFFLFFSYANLFSENYQISGGQSSQINYRMVQKIQPSSNINKLLLSYVIPVDYYSPTYNQSIASLSFDFSPKPATRTEKIDLRGNKVIEVLWEAPIFPVTTIINLTAKNKVKLESINSSAPFPLVNLTEDVSSYLIATEQVNCDDEEIRKKALELTGSAEAEFDAVQKILTWVVDHLNYVLIPESYSAAYSFKSGKGNCQNYSHLAAALMRAVGIPVRIVNGIALEKPYDIKMVNGTLTTRMAQGRHSWVEIYFPDLGWVPFDPAGTELFVSNRFIRVEVGLDNEETCQDGLISWSYTKGTTDKPQFEENINAEFIADQVDLLGQRMNYGPRELLLCPEIETRFTKIALAPVPPPPVKLPEKDIKSLDYKIPFLFGNLEFPENEDFLSTRVPVQTGEENRMEMRKNFLVETAEYVTTQGQQYAQTFLLEKPVKLIKIGLALHWFNNEGQIWVELLKDDNGKPGEYLATSELITLEQMERRRGYSWVDFDFNGSELILAPGHYWVALGFTGGPIVNWFFTYGHPVGPQDGTRYKAMFNETWSRSLSFEFNYRVEGFTTE